VFLKVSFLKKVVHVKEKGSTEFVYGSMTATCKTA